MGDHREMATAKTETIMVLYLCILVIGLLANGLVLVLFAVGRLRLCNVLISVLSLTIADTLSLLNMTPSAVPVDWPGWLCTLQVEAGLVLSTVSSLTLVYIAYERYDAMQKQAVNTTRGKTRALNCLAIWAVSLVAVGPFLVTLVTSDRHHARDVFSAESCVFVPITTVVYVITFVNVIVPALLITGFYTAFIALVWWHPRVAPSVAAVPGQQWRVTRQLAGVIFLYLLAHTPYLFALTAIHLDHRGETELNVRTSSLYYALTYLTPMTNPFMYALAGLLQDCCCCCAGTCAPCLCRRRSSPPAADRPDSVYSPPLGSDGDKPQTQRASRA